MSQFRSATVRCQNAAKVDGIMRAVRVPAGARLWVAIGLTFIVALFAASPAWTAGPAFAPADHHISADGDSDHLAAVDHEHIGVAAIQGDPDSVGDIMASRARTALIAAGLVFALALLWELSPRYSLSVGRDPPRTPLVVLTGQDVLARLCIARR
ncbi:hypothetical protein [Mycolicibacterium llatzerense]|uniref:hypothetical protein n=1 Tax=Mycolicibacterium llatzerense TaxID=280871 RepID=UPI0013A6B0FF|nr:hypothetical protein [Mycolicibacterium llatzerense]HPX37969.1 hypothetical protein [Mycobacterium sp.]